MRKIFNRKSNFNIKFIFGIIFLLLLFILDLKGNNHILSFKESFIDYVSNPIYISILYIKNKIYIIKNNIFVLNNLIKENKELKKIILLKNIQQLELDNCKKENKSLKNIININLPKKYCYIFAKVISYNFELSKLIINKGKKDNLFVGQPVLNEKGILGQVMSVNKNTSCIILTCNSLHKIPVKILRNNIKFIINGSGMYENLQLKDLNIFLNEDIKENDLLISSGLDGKFPEGIPVGYISKVEKNNKKFHLNINAKTIFKIKDIEYLVLIKN